jgi:hypothetical protein
MIKIIRSFSRPAPNDADAEIRRLKRLDQEKWRNETVNWALKYSEKRKLPLHGLPRMLIRHRASPGRIGTIEMMEELLHSVGFSFKGEHILNRQSNISSIVIGWDEELHNMLVYHCTREEGQAPYVEVARNDEISLGEVVTLSLGGNW